MQVKNIYKKQTNGFTIVELLIVIVVIGILAAIVIVAYNNVQNRAKTAAGAQLASTIAKKAEVYKTMEGNLPSYAELRSTTGPEEARLDELYSTGYRPNPFTAEAADNGKRVAYWRHCGRSSVVYWDFSANQQMLIRITNEGKSIAEPAGTGEITC